MVGVPALGRGSCVWQFLLYSICISTFSNLAATQFALANWDYHRVHTVVA